MKRLVAYNNDDIEDIDDEQEEYSEEDKLAQIDNVFFTYLEDGSNMDDSIRARLLDEIDNYNEKDVSDVKGILQDSGVLNMKMLHQLLRESLPVSLEKLTDYGEADTVFSSERDFEDCIEKYIDKNYTVDDLVSFVQDFAYAYPEKWESACS